jgi:hypothetical protein
MIMRKMESKTLAITKIVTIVVTISSMLGIPLLAPAQAEMVAKNAMFYLDKNTTIDGYQLEGSANYPTFRYEVSVYPKNGALVLDPDTGKIGYTPNTGFTGIDSFNYRIVSELNSNWYSSKATVRAAVGEPWNEYCDAKLTPIGLSTYMKDSSLGVPANSPEIIGTTNIEPIKATPYGKMAYTNSKIAVELSGQSWWALSLGQKAFLIEQYCILLDKAELRGYTG